MFTEDYINQMIDFCQRLIQTPGIHGSERDVALLVKSEMEKSGFEDIRIDKWGNVIGKVGSSSHLSPILLDCHLDTVGITDESLWTYPPFSGKMVDGKIYGRGASDMRGALAAALYALKYLQKTNNLKREVYLSGTVCEEIQEGIAFKQVLDEVKPGLVVICEASNLNLKIGQRGRAEVVIETSGKSAHSSNPQIGINAVKKMLKILNHLDEIELPRHKHLAPAIMEVTDIHSEPYPGMSIIPDRCKITIDRRLMVGETVEGVINSINTLIDKLKKDDPDIKAKVYIAEADFSTYTNERLKTLKFAPAWYFSPEEDFVKKAYEGLKSAGLKPEVTTYDFCTNGSMSAGYLKIPTLGFGPCFENRAHTIDEFIYIKELIDALKGYVGLIQSLSQ